MGARFQRLSRRTAWLFATLLLTLPAICAGGEAAAIERRPVWEKLDQFVAVETQDPVGNETAVNDHPAQVSAQALRSNLGALRVRLEEDREPVPLFTAAQLEQLSDWAAKALAAAGPREDVTFALVGLHPGPFGLKQPEVTTGRLFVRQDRLNLILGMVHEPVSDRDDRRLKPFVPGARSKSASPLWRISATDGQVTQLNADRPDWLVLYLSETPAKQQEATPRDGKAASPATVPRPAPSAGKTVEERLLLLNDLREKKLITDEEYLAKRKEILDGI